MSQFTIAESVVEFGAKDTALFESMHLIFESLQEFELSFKHVAAVGKAVFLGLAGAAVLFTKQAMDSSDAFEKMRVALQDDSAAKSLEEFAVSLQLVTQYSKDAVQEGIALAANLGVQKDQMKEVTEVGIGLAQKFFGGDLQEGMRAAALAVNGNFRQLQRLIPALRDTKDAAQQLAIVQRLGEQGFKQSQEIDTTSKALKQLWHQLGEVGEAFGKHLLPYLRDAARFFEAVALRLQDLTEDQTKSIVKWAAIAAGIAAVIGFAPEIVAFSTIVVKSFSAIFSAVLALAESLGSVLLSPMGLVVAGVAAMATAFAYFIGVGDTATKRTIDGFLKIADFLDHLLGSWKGFTEGVGMLWDQLGSYLLEGWINTKNYLLDGWENIAEAGEVIWNDFFEGLANGWNYVKTAAQKFFTWLMASQKNINDTVGDWIDNMLHPNRTQEEKDYLKQERERDAAAKNRQYQIDQNKADTAYDKEKNSIAADFGAAKREAQQRRQANRNANDKQANDDLAQAELNRQKNLQDAMKRFDQLPKLSDKLKELYEKVKSGAVGSVEELLKGIQDQAKQLQDMANDKKSKAANSLKGAGNLELQRGKFQTPQMQDISQTFRQQQAMRLLGARNAMNPQIQLMAKHYQAQQTTNRWLEQINKNLIANGKKPVPATVG